MLDLPPVLLSGSPGPVTGSPQGIGVAITRAVADQPIERQGRPGNVSGLAISLLSDSATLLPGASIDLDRKMIGAMTGASSIACARARPSPGRHKTRLGKRSALALACEADPGSRRATDDNEGREEAAPGVRDRDRVEAAFP